jgi:hypothetical protein
MNAGFQPDTAFRNLQDLHHKCALLLQKLAQTWAFSSLGVWANNKKNGHLRARFFELGF